MASAGAVIEIVGFVLLARATTHVSQGLLLTSLAIVVSGFAFITPSLNSLLSRWSDPAKQGGILGIGQSISSLARIFGPMVAVPLSQNYALASALGMKAAELPLLLASAMMAAGLVLVVIATRRGRDYPTTDPAAVSSDPLY